MASSPEQNRQIRSTAQKHGNDVSARDKDGDIAMDEYVGSNENTASQNTFGGKADGPDTSSTRTSNITPLGRIEWCCKVGTGYRIILNAGTDSIPFFVHYSGSAFLGSTLSTRAEVNFDKVRREFPFKSSGVIEDMDNISDIVYVGARTITYFRAAGGWITKSALKSKKCLGPKGVESLVKRLETRRDGCRMAIHDSRTNNIHPDTKEAFTIEDGRKQPWLIGLKPGPSPIRAVGPKQADKDSAMPRSSTTAVQSQRSYGANGTDTAVTSHAENVPLQEPSESEVPSGPWGGTVQPAMQEDARTKRRQRDDAEEDPAKRIKLEGSGNSPDDSTAFASNNEATAPQTTLEANAESSEPSQSSNSTAEDRRQCGAETKSGNKCKSSPRKGEEYCHKHSKQAERRCEGSTNSGDRCKLPPREGEAYCHHHLSSVAGKEN